MRYRSSPSGVAARLAFAAAGCGGDDGGGGRRRGSEDVSGSISTMAIWAGEEQESFQAVIDAFEEKFPNVTSSTRRGDNLAPLLSTAVEGGNPRTRRDRPARPDGGLREAERDQADRQPARRDRRRLRRGRGSCRRGRRETVRPDVQGRQQIDRLVQFSDVRGGRRRAARDMGRAPPRSVTRSRQPDYAVLGRRRPGLADHGSLREHLHPQRRREKYDQLAKHEIPWTDQSVKDALDDHEGRRRRLATWPAEPRGAFNGDAGLMGQGIPRRPAGLDGHHRRLRPGRHTEATLEPETGTTCSLPRRSRTRARRWWAADLFVKFEDSPAADAFLDS